MTGLVGPMVAGQAPVVDPAAALIALLQDPVALQAKVAELNAVRADIDAKLALVGPAEEIPELHAKAVFEREAARAQLLEAQAGAAKVLADAAAEAQRLLAAARAEAEQVTADARAEQATAKAVAEKARRRAAERDAVLDAREKQLAARESDLDAAQAAANEQTVEAQVKHDTAIAMYDRYAALVERLKAVMAET